ncbi:MAG TPA: hypothetical protein VN419_10200 [Humidesulfovibrio sp.]|uniref:hypothetical protein n=1 Tax=Humidesulfovibrio sp. TaxID=2910988 RepID=UPI002BB10F1D|nr:hypothetical protein [Humidesulfovibrio sp.]HWR04376.1 hypothetical protein [Humidesulfovibrio sp.]
MYASIINGSVCEVTEALPAPGALFLECGENVRGGWVIQGGTCVAPEPEPAENPNAAIDAQIAVLEAAQHRATRELLLGSDSAVLAEAKARLAETDALIAALRARRV